MTTAMPAIGVIPLWDGGRESIWMLPGYLDGVSRAGGIPLTLPLEAEEQALRQLADSLDGLLLTGGPDLDPARYGAAPSPACGELCPQRDRLEWRLLELALEQDKPVLGICRGLQLLNAYLGGTLYQHLPEELEGGLDHQQKPPYHQPAHVVRVLPGTALHRMLGRESLEVNSCHHQGIRALAPALTPCALAPDGLVEAAAQTGSRFVLGVQWHPEFMPDTAHSRALFAAFVDACRER